MPTEGSPRLCLPLSILMILALAIVAVGAMVGGFAARGDAAASIGSGTIAVSDPGAPQPLNTSFQVQASLTVFAPYTSTTWGGYDFELAYDNGVLQATDDARGLCTSSGWGPIALAPHVISGCSLQSSAATGVLETITFRCIAEGSSALRLLARTDPQVQQAGTALFDENGGDFNTTLVNGSVTCGTPPTATPTDTATPTNTPLATNTVPPTNTATNTATRTNTPVVTPTNTPTPTATPLIPTPTVVVGGCVVGDTDCDGCSDLSEAQLHPPTDPTNPWDFYSVPVPALFAASAPMTDVRDSSVTASDAQAIFAYFKKSAHTGTVEYEQDLNQNAKTDGSEYDRSVAGPGQSGPPDGIVTAQDAQLAFAQFKNGYHC